MKILRNIALLLSLSQGIAFGQYAVEGNIGAATIVSDSFYGMALGTALGGLVMAAEDNYDKSTSRLAKGALFGTAVGFSVGIAETWFHYSRSHLATKSGFRTQLFALEGKKMGLGFDWKF